MKYFLSSLLLLFQFSIIFCQDPVLVADFNPGTDDSFDRFNFLGLEINNRLVFPITSSDLGVELAVLEDGELSLLMDINVGAESSSPNEFVLLGDNIFFTAVDAVNGGGLWSTDGTAENTVLISDMEDTSSTRPSGLIVSESGWIYYTFDNDLYRNNGLANEFIASNVRFFTSFNQAANNSTTYRDEVAYLVEGDDVVELYTIENNEQVLLATSPETSSFPDFFGLNEINGGLIFTIEDRFEDSVEGMYFYDEQNGTLTMSRVGNRFPFRMETFNSERVFTWFSGNGFYAVNGLSGQENLLFSSDDATFFSGESIPNGVYEDNIVFYYDEGSFGDNFLCFSDGTTSGSQILLNPTDRFPSNIILDNEFAFIATGTSNGFNPEMHFVNMRSGTAETFYTSSLSSLSTNSILLLGVQNGNLYFISNLDQTVGQELYSIPLDFISSTKSFESFDGDIQILEDHFVVTMDQDLSLASKIFTIDGKLLESRKIRSNTNIALPSYSGILIINVYFEGKQLTKKVIRNTN